MDPGRVAPRANRTDRSLQRGKGQKRVWEAAVWVAKGGLEGKRGEREGTEEAETYGEGQEATRRVLEIERSEEKRGNWIVKVFDGENQRVVIRDTEIECVNCKINLLLLYSLEIKTERVLWEQVSNAAQWLYELNSQWRFQIVYIADGCTQFISRSEIYVEWDNTKLCKSI